MLRNDHCTCINSQARLLNVQGLSAKLLPVFGESFRGLLLRRPFTICCQLNSLILSVLASSSAVVSRFLKPSSEGDPVVTSLTPELPKKICSNYIGGIV